MSPDIAYLRPPPEQSDHNGSEDSQLHNFSSKSADKETIKPSGQFLPDKHVPGFGDDDRQPNTAGYEHRNRAGKIENGKISKQQNDEALTEHNPAPQFVSEQTMTSSLNKPDSKESDAGTPESTKRDGPVYPSHLHPYHYNYHVNSHFRSENSDVHFEVLLDAKPFIPHPKKHHGAGEKGLRAGIGPTAEEHSKSQQKHNEFSKSIGSKLKFGKKKGKNRKR